MKKYLVSLMLLAVVCVPVFTSAATVDELLAMIAQLQAQLAALQGNQPPAPTNVCYQFTRSIGVGSRGQDVLRLQRLLIDEGYLQADGPTTYYGAMTRAAVVAFQNANGISPANGVLGAQARAALNALCVSAFSTTTATTTTNVGQVNVRLNQSSPANRMLSISSNMVTPGVVLGIFDFKVENTSATATIYSLIFKLAGLHSDSPASTLYQNARLVDSSGRRYFANSLSYDGTVTFSSLNISLPRDQWRSFSFEVDIPAGVPTGSIGQVLITANNETIKGADSDYNSLRVIPSIVISKQTTFITGAVATTTQPSITVISPNGGENWKIGETRNITWASQGFNATNYNVQIGIIDTRYSTEVGARAEQTIANNIPNSGSYAWTIPQTIGTMDLTDTNSAVYKIIVHSRSDSVTGVALGDSSNNPFSISNVSQTKSVSFTAPTGGNMTAGKQVSVSWTGTGFTPNSETGRLYLYNNNGSMVANPYQDYIDKGQTVDGWNLYLAGGSFNPTLRRDLPNGVYQFVMKNLAGVELGRSAHFTVGALAVAQLQVGGPSVSATPIPNGNNPVTAYAVNFTFNLFNIGDLNAYVSKNVVAFLGDTTSGGGQLTGVVTAPISGDTSTAYVIPAGGSRMFAVNGRLSQVSNSSSESMKIVAINYGLTASNPTGQSVTAGLEPLFIVQYFGGGSVVPPSSTAAQIEVQPMISNWPGNTKAFGENISVYAPIRNSGGAIASNVRLDWYYDSRLIKSPIITTVPANSGFVTRSETSLALPKPAIGTHRVKMYVTANGVRQETSLEFTVTSAPVSAASQSSLDQMAGVLNSLAEIIGGLR